MAEAFKVVVSEYDETLVSFASQPSPDSMVDGSMHFICNGIVSLERISDSHRAICCSICHMRLPIPHEIITLDQLRKHFERYNT